MGKAGAGKVIHDTDGQKKFESAEHALKHGYIDEIVAPEDTRSRIIDILASVDK
jgi:acetyl-CoA carboxylase beta subunit